MRFSAVATLCAAPLALAGTLQADLVERGAVELETGISISKGSSGKGDDNKSSGSSVDEIIVIWVNQGGGAATSTVTNTVTVTDASGTSAAKATHSVSLLG
jgi:hypothetical protein